MMGKNLFTHLKNHFMIKILQKVQEEMTGARAKLLSIGGGIYTRALKNVVALEDDSQDVRLLFMKRMNS